jgi:hypothetical protein
MSDSISILRDGRLVMGLVAVLTYLSCGMRVWMIVWAVNEGLDRVCMRVFVAGKSCSWRGYCFGVGWRKYLLSLDNHSHLNHQEKRECV